MYADGSFNPEKIEDGLCRGHLIVRVSIVQHLLFRFYIIYSRLYGMNGQDQVRC